MKKMTLNRAFDIALGDIKVSIKEEALAWRAISMYLSSLPIEWRKDV